MLFNTLVFWSFFLLVYILYLSLQRSLRAQNILLLLASYIFYGYWNWKLLSLLLFSTVLDYFCGIRIHENSSSRKRRFYLILSVAGNLSLLGFFKYFNFFLESTQVILERIGLPAPRAFLRIALPIGISFYTFQTMSYTLDIYRRKLAPTRDFLNFALFVSFFPQLVAGPIERATHLLPQILSPRKITLSQLREGGYLILWGLYKKSVVADNLARIVDRVFGGGYYTGGEVLISLYAFAFQVYGDFSGYSDIARGLGRLMGFDIVKNFNLPYFSSNIRELWRRWHISLTTWLRDYLYITLGGNRRGRLQTYRNIFLTLLLGGVWHGANWNFVLWGAYHGILMCGHRVFRNRKFLKCGKGWEILSTLFTFHLVVLGYLLFRSGSISQIKTLGTALFLRFFLTPQTIFWTGEVLFFISLLLVIEIVELRRGEFAILNLRPVVRGLLFLIIVFSLVVFGVTGGREFVYFQF